MNIRLETAVKPTLHCFQQSLHIDCSCPNQINAYLSEPLRFLMQGICGNAFKFCFCYLKTILLCQTKYHSVLPNQLASFCFKNL